MNGLVWMRYRAKLLFKLVFAVVVHVVISDILIAHSPVLRPTQRMPTERTAPMKLRGDYMEIDNDDDVVIIKGNAYIEYGDMQLWADSIQGSLLKNEVQAQGNVRFTRTEEDLRGEFLFYNYATRRGRMTNLRTKRGINWIKAARVEIEPYEIRGWDVAATTCDHNPPHYHLQAAKMVLHPDDRLVLSRVALVKGGRPRIRFPRYVVDMRPAGRQGNRLYLSPGYSGSRGFNLRSSYSFYFSPRAYGRTWFHPSQQGDHRFGIDVHYRPTEDSRGAVTYSEYRSSTLQQDETRLTLNHHHRLSSRTTANLDARYTSLERQGTGLTEELNIDLRTRTTLDEWDLALQFQKRTNLTGDSPIQSVDGIPRLTFSQRNPHSIFGSNVTLRLEGRWERLRETSLTDVITSSKSEITAHLSPGPLNIGNWSTWNLNLRDTISWYSAAGSRNVFALNLSTLERYGPRLSSSVNYTFQSVRGDTPFITYDRLLDRNTATWFLRYNRPQRFSATLFQTSYDFNENIFTAASSNFVLRNALAGDLSWSTGLSLVYDLGDDPSTLSNLSVRNVSANLRMERRDMWRHTIIGNYDVPTRRLSSISASTDFLLSPRTRFQGQTNYSFDPFTESLERTRLNVALVRDLHCWEGRLRIDVEQREAFFEFYLKEAAGTKLSIGVDYDEAFRVDPQFVDGERPGTSFSAF